MHLVSITRSKSHGAKSWFYPEQYHLSKKRRLPQLQRPTGSWHYYLSLFEAKNSNFLSSMPCGAAICCYTQKKPKQLQPSFQLAKRTLQQLLCNNRLDFQDTPLVNPSFTTDAIYYCKLVTGFEQYISTVNYLFNTDFPLLSF